MQGGVLFKDENNDMAPSVIIYENMLFFEIAFTHGKKDILCGIERLKTYIV